MSDEYETDFEIALSLKHSAREELEIAEREGNQRKADAVRHLIEALEKVQPGPAARPMAPTVH
ncbi:MAG: hypothetical protein Q8M31_23795 [Beijerinckiaceae bacterium]|nr:hypothetical protein [Beijerinckiaceae bacterium]